jgi:uncharacterized protein
MSIQVNLRHLELKEAHLEGELSPEELDVQPKDEIVQVTKPLYYDLTVQKLDGGLLAQGSLRIELDCECVRCLKRIQYDLHLPEWSSLYPLEGEEAVPVVNDCVSLTPYIREDILLEFPQRPLCDQECRGLPKASVSEPKMAADSAQPVLGASAWAELNKLKF